MNSFFSLKTNKDGSALAMTIVMVSMLAVVLQSIFTIASARSGLLGEMEGIYRAEKLALNGLECGLSQAIYQQALEGGEQGYCGGQLVNMVDDSSGKFDVVLNVADPIAGCFQTYIRRDKTNNYTVQSTGYLICNGSLPDQNAFGQKRITKVMKVTQTDNGDVQRAMSVFE